MTVREKRFLPPVALQPGVAAVLFLVAPLFVACPQTEPTSLAIREVRISNDDPNATTFVISILGQGFGLQSVAYNVGTGEGSTQTDETRVLIRGPQDSRTFERSSIRIISPQRMDVDVSLAAPLSPGTYELSILLEDQPVFSLAEAFVIGNTPIDGGVPPQPDTGVPNEPMDAGPRPDAEVPDGGEDLPDVGFPDVGPRDAGFGPFQGNYQYRRLVQADNTVWIPANTTLRVPVPHGDLVGAGQSKIDGSDLAVFQGNTLLTMSFEEPSAVGSNDLALIVRLAEDLSVGIDLVAPLFLYYGDPQAQNTPSDGVFDFIARFDDPVSPEESGNDQAWRLADGWEHCAYDRPIETELDPNNPNTFGAYCIRDTEVALYRQTISTPRVLGMQNNPPNNVIYEMSVWMSGQYLESGDDGIYFSIGDDNETFADTDEPDLDEWQGPFTPGNRNLRFIDNDNDDRRVNAFTFGTVFEWWRRAHLRFIPSLNQPSLHLRSISLNNASASLVVIDDWWVRRTIEPEPVVTLDDAETP